MSTRYIASLIKGGVFTAVHFNILDNLNGVNMDIADEAQSFQEALIALALRKRVRRPESLDGWCIWCKEEKVVASTAFCSAECGEDYHKLQRARSRAFAEYEG